MRILTASALGLLMATGMGQAIAAPDWGKAEATEITVFYPGTAAWEWVLSSDHSGKRAIQKKGEACTGCHEGEEADIGAKIASGKKLESAPDAKRAGSIPVSVKGALDGDKLALRFEWKSPAAAGTAADEANALKVAVMLETGKVDKASQVGCWATCHDSVRTMPNGKADKTKYVEGGALASGNFYDLIQYRSGEKKVFDGYIADKRVMEGGKALVSAEGKQEGGKNVVVFTRKLSGGEGDVKLAKGGEANMGFAIHENHAEGRYHYVSLGYKLMIGKDGTVSIRAVE